MKKLPSKQDIRRQIESQVDDYVCKGGAIEDVPQGVSGREDHFNGQRPIQQLFDQPKQARTHIPEVLAALNERQQVKKYNPKKATVKKPKQKVLYDDFGEPIRRVWVEE